MQKGLGGAGPWDILLETTHGMSRKVCWKEKEFGVRRFIWIDPGTTVCNKRKVL